MYFSSLPSSEGHAEFRSSISNVKLISSSKVVDSSVSVVVASVVAALVVPDSVVVDCVVVASSVVTV